MYPFGRHKVLLVDEYPSENVKNDENEVTTDSKGSIDDADDDDNDDADVDGDDVTDDDSEDLKSFLAHIKGGKQSSSRYLKCAHLRGCSSSCQIDCLLPNLLLPTFSVVAL